MTIPKARATAIFHFGPAADRVGGIASVIAETMAMPLGVDQAHVVTFCDATIGSRLACWRSALGAASRTSSGDVGHLHVSQRLDLLRSWTLARRLRRTGATYIVTIHGSSILQTSAVGLNILRSVLAGARRVAVLNEDTADLCRRLGADPWRLENPTPPPRDGRPLGDRAGAVFAGEVGRRKGVDRLVAAWPLVRAAVPEASLTVLGPVTGEVEVPTRDGITPGGTVSRERLSGLLEAARVAILPSRAEAQPMFVIEALAAGTPVVATNIGDIRELIGEGGRCIASTDAPQTLADAVVELLTDDDAWLAAAAAASNLSNRRQQRQVSAYRDLYGIGGGS